MGLIINPFIEFPPAALEWTWESNLSSSTGWSSSDETAITVDTGNQDISWTVSRGSNDSISYDLSSVSDSEWVLRFTTRWTTIGGSSATNQQCPSTPSSLTY